MVPLPLFKLAALFVRHVSKYGANRIKIQAHDHPRFRSFAARYGQLIHQLNMRMSVALLRNVEAEMKAKEKAETPTVLTEEQMRKKTEKEEREKEKARAAAAAVARAGDDAQAAASSHSSSSALPPSASSSSQLPKKEAPRSIWRRKFRPLPEAKAVDLFADVIGDAFILVVAAGLILYEYQKASSKPDANLERIKELQTRIDELRQREEELESEERRQANRILTLEETLRNYKDPKTKLPLLPPPPTAATS